MFNNSFVQLKTMKPLPSFRYKQLSICLGSWLKIRFKEFPFLCKDVPKYIKQREELVNTNLVQNVIQDTLRLNYEQRDAGRQGLLCLYIYFLP